ncbi:hypothetical protein MMPV_005510 [Pyropia vietnamensis]
MGPGPRKLLRRRPPAPRDDGDADVLGMDEIDAFVASRDAARLARAGASLDDDSDSEESAAGDAETPVLNLDVGSSDDGDSDEDDDDGDDGGGDDDGDDHDDDDAYDERDELTPGPSGWGARPSTYRGSDTRDWALMEEDERTEALEDEAAAAAAAAARASAGLIAADYEDVGGNALLATLLADVRSAAAEAAVLASALRALAARQAAGVVGKAAAGAGCGPLRGSGSGRGAAAAAAPVVTSSTTARVLQVRFHLVSLLATVGAYYLSLAAGGAAGDGAAAANDLTSHPAVAVLLRLKRAMGVDVVGGQRGKVPLDLARAVLASDAVDGEAESAADDDHAANGAANVADAKADAADAAATGEAGVANGATVLDSDQSLGDSDGSAADSLVDSDSEAAAEASPHSSPAPTSAAANKKRRRDRVAAPEQSDADWVASLVTRGQASRRPAPPPDGGGTAWAAPVGADGVSRARQLARMTGRLRQAAHVAAAAATAQRTTSGDVDTGLVAPGREERAAAAAAARVTAAEKAARPWDNELTPSKGDAAAGGELGDDADGFDDDDGLDGMSGGEAAFYAAIAARTQAAKAAKAAKAAQADKRKVGAPGGASAAPHVYTLADEVGPNGRRGASKQVLANRGLTPRRSKARKNPRSKHRAAFEKALVRRKGAVVEGRTPSAVYGGEASGINVRTRKSIRL